MVVKWVSVILSRMGHKDQLLPNAWIYQRAGWAVKQGNGVKQLGLGLVEPFKSINIFP